MPKLGGTKMNIEQQVEKSLRDALEPTECSVVQVSPGHFEIAVRSTIFDGKSTLQKHRLVLSQVAPFMKGDNAPVHAIDKIDARTPGG